MSRSTLGQDALLRAEFAAMSLERCFAPSHGCCRYRAHTCRSVPGCQAGIAPYIQTYIHVAPLAVFCAIDSPNLTVQSFEIPKAVHLSAEEWTPENGMLTPTFKIKREIVKRAFQTELEALYAQLKQKGFGKKPANTIDVHSCAK